MSITKIEAERKGVAPKVQVSLQPSVIDVETSKLEGLGKKPQDVLNIKFSFETKFNPEVGKLKIEGSVLYLDENIKKVFKEWQKNKKLPDDVHAQVMNAVFRNIIPKALFISNELQLPPILPMPRVLVKRAEKKK